MIGAFDCGDVSLGKSVFTRSAIAVVPSVIVKVTIPVLEAIVILVSSWLIGWLISKSAAPSPAKPIPEDSY